MNPISPPDQPPARVLSVEQQRAILWRRIQYAGNWWYWIAGITIVNTVLLFSHSTWGFAIGTGITDVVYGFTTVYPGFLVPGVVIEIMIVGLIGLWGYLCQRGMLWAFWVGLILYGVDTVLEVLMKQWIGAAFHAYAIYSIYQGVVAINLLKKLDKAVAAQAPYYAQAAYSQQPAPPPQQPGSQWYPGMTTPGQTPPEDPSNRSV